MIRNPMDIQLLMSPREGGSRPESRNESTVRFPENCSDMWCEACLEGIR